MNKTQKDKAALFINRHKHKILRGVLALGVSIQLAANAYFIRAGNFEDELYCFAVVTTWTILTSALAFALGGLSSIGWCAMETDIAVGQEFMVIRKIEGSDTVGPFSAAVSEFPHDKRKLRLIVLRGKSVKERGKYKIGRSGKVECMTVPQLN